MVKPLQKNAYLNAGKSSLKAGTLPSGNFHMTQVVQNLSFKVNVNLQSSGAAASTQGEPQINPQMVCSEYNSY